MKIKNYYNDSQRYDPLIIVLFLTVHPGNPMSPEIPLFPGVPGGPGTPGGPLGPGGPGCPLLPLGPVSPLSPCFPKLRTILLYYKTVIADRFFEQIDILNYFLKIKTSES